MKKKLSVFFPPETCGAMDVGVLIDASESISEKDFQNVKWTLINITNTFKVSKDGTHFGVIVYSDDPVLHVKFDDSEYQKPSNLAKKILALPWIGEGTRTDKAVEFANTALFTPGAGMRTNKPQVLILFTDGNTNPVTSRSPKEILKPLQVCKYYVKHQLPSVVHGELFGQFFKYIFQICSI